MYRIGHIVLSGIYFALPIALIFFKPDLGSAMLLSIIWLVTLIVSGIKKRHLLVILSVGLILFASGWSFVLQDYQKNRILSFVEPALDPLGMGWSQLQSKIAVGNGGIFGTGFQQGSQTMYGFLSEPQTDFIFASIAEQFGFVGIVFLFTLFGVLIVRVLKLAREAQSNFPRLVGAGFATLLIVEIGINVAMNLGLLPIVGLPLPLVSYGGSSLIMGYMGLGILQSIKTR
jgi:rod shape determining protein RodA